LCRAGGCPGWSAATSRSDGEAALDRRPTGTTTPSSYREDAVATASTFSQDAMTNGERRDEMTRLLLTSDEAAGMLGIGRTKVYELMASGRLRSVKIDRCRRISAGALAEFVACLDREAA